MTSTFTFCFVFVTDFGKFETIVYNVSASGKLVEKYNGVVDLEIAYDPQGISCKISCTGKPRQADKMHL